MTQGRDVRLGRDVRGGCLAAMARAGVAMVLTNPYLPDNPIVYVNDAFEQVTGYSRLGGDRPQLPVPAGAADRSRPPPRPARGDRRRATRCRSTSSTTAPTAPPYRNRLLVSPVHDADGAGQLLRRHPEGAVARGGAAQPVGAWRRGAARDPAPGEEPPRHDRRPDPHAAARRAGARRLRHAGPPGGEPAAPLRGAEPRRRPPQHRDRISLGAYLSRIVQRGRPSRRPPGHPPRIDMAPMQADADTAARIGLSCPRS